MLTESPSLWGAMVTHWLGLAKPLLLYGPPFPHGTTRNWVRIARDPASTDILWPPSPGGAAVSTPALGPGPRFPALRRALEAP